MATPPFDLDHTAPAPTDLVSSFPSNEQSNRDIIESWLTILSDPATGLLKATAIVLPLSLTQAAASTILTLTSTDAGATAGPNINLHRNSATPAAADIGPAVLFSGEDSAGNETVYGDIVVRFDDVTNGSEDGSLLMQVISGGSSVNAGIFNSAGLTVTGAVVASAGISGTTGTFSGAVSAASYGAVNGTTGTFSGALNANSLGITTSIISGSLATGALSASTGTFSAGITSTTLDVSSSIQTPTLTLEGATGLLIWEADPDTWIRRLSEDVIQFVAGGIQRMIADTSGVDVNGALTATSTISTSTGHIYAGGTVFAGSAAQVILSMTTATNAGGLLYLRPDGYNDATSEMIFSNAGAIHYGNYISMNTGGFHTAGKTASNPATVGASMISSGQINATVSGDVCSILNRTSSEGSIMHIRNDNVTEGTISEAAGVVTYGTFFGAHWSQLENDNSRPPILRGTICEHIDEVCHWDDNPYPEPLPKFKVSDTYGTTRPYGVFSTWDLDDDSGDAYIGGLGTFFIRIDATETVQGGDWIMSAGNGCGVVMDPMDDPRKHVATVTAAVVSEVYPDGSYLVPCTLHCG